MVRIQEIVESIPEDPQEADDPVVFLVQLRACGFGTQLPASLEEEYIGHFKLRRAYRILRRIGEAGGRDFYLRIQMKPLA